jgi:hypothetical protein
MRSWVLKQEHCHLFALAAVLLRSFKSGSQSYFSKNLLILVQRALTSVEATELKRWKRSRTSVQLGTAWLQL